MEQVPSYQGDGARHRQDRPFYPKRPHKKSRMGCQNCKTRKVKCDEKRPSCQTCTLRSEQCIYVVPFKHIPSTKLLPAANRSRTGSPSSSISASKQAEDMTTVVVMNEPVAALPGCDPTDMKIIWHFMVNTCSSFSIETSGSRPGLDVMRVHVMKHALDVRFLFRSVLALSCLHARNFTGEDMGDATRHLLYQTESLHEYRRAIEAAEPKTFGALLANSLLITATSAQTFRDPQGPNLYILQWLLVWRGIGVIFQRIHRSALTTTGLSQLFYRPSMNLKEAAKHIPQTLISLIASIEPQDADFAHKNTYLHGLKYLGTLYHNLREGGLGPVMKLRIITWFTFLPTSLVELFRGKQDRALVILAHYAVFLKFAAGVWWLVGVGDRSLRDICSHLGHRWYWALEVPLRAIPIEDMTELGRLLLDDPFWEPCSLPEELRIRDLERETKQLGLVDDEGRPVRFAQDVGSVVLAEPGEPGEKPVWNMDG